MFPPPLLLWGGVKHPESFLETASPATPHSHGPRSSPQGGPLPRPLASAAPLSLAPVGGGGGGGGATVLQSSGRSLIGAYGQYAKSRRSTSIGYRCVRGRGEPSVHPLHLPQDLALVGGQQGAVVRHLLEHGPALELIAGFFKVVSATDRQGVGGLACTPHDSYHHANANR